MKKACAVIVAAFVVSASVTAFAQSPASNKAFFTKSLDEITLAPVADGASAEVTLFDIPQALKTSNGGAVSAILSMEASLWTYNLTTAIVNGGKNSSSSRAAIKAWVEIDGVPMEPEKVVYADRLQATGLTVNLACQTSTLGETCTVTGDIALELFQATKNANSFVFFAGPLAPTIHSVQVKAQGFVECRNNSGEVIACPVGTLAGYENASTMAAIGKATLLLEEQQNWGGK